MYVVLYHLNHCRSYVISCCTRNGYFVWLWNDYFVISSSMSHSLLTLVCMLFLFTWIIIERMWLAVWKEVITLYDCDTLIDSFPAQICILLFIVWIIVAGMLLAVWQRVITFYYDMIIILYPVHWLILYFLSSVCYFLSFELL